MTSNAASRVRFSIITPVFDPNPTVFRECVMSVIGQSYPDWEWCLVDDGSTDPWVWRYLKRLNRRHPRIRIARRDRNGGISRASNDAIAMASGEFLAFLDNDDVLHSDALSVVNHELYLDPTLDFLYSDEDKIDDSGHHHSFFRKPDWSPELLLGQNYCCHLTVLRTSIVREVGGLRPECDGAQDHDLLLRTTEKTDRIRHIPQILYHWRASSTSHAASVDAKPYTAGGMERAISDACERRGIEAELVPVDYGYFRVRRRLTSTPRVSIIVPTRGTTGTIWGMECVFLENFLRSSLAKTSYPDVEYIIVYDSGTDPTLLRRIEALPLSTQLVEFREKFNFSKKCNLGAIHSTGERLLFVNDDVEVITPEWIERLTAFLEDESVGATGPLLLYENGLIESAGHSNDGPKNFASSMTRNSPYGVSWPLKLNREVSGVTGACLSIRRDTFFQLGGFSELFAENFNDVDLCLKLTTAGYRIVWTPDAELFHFEFKSRSRKMDPTEKELLNRFWGHVVGRGRRDPYLPNLE